MVKQKTNLSTPPPGETRPPIVAVLGHVDHGKTSLLDSIRKSQVAAREHGGITQHIGAYQIALPPSKGQKESAITFIDTPGHEAFAAMRSRGATAADIAILVVAADDSVKPQTIESIAQIKAAGIPMIVAMNKMDLEAANPDKVKKDLAKNGIQVEGFGGDIPLVPVSAKTGKGIKELLEMIVLVAEMKGLPGNSNAELAGHVIETRVDKGKGMVATLIIKQGTLSYGMPLYEGDTNIVKVRAMFDEYGKPVKFALPSRPVEVLGFTKLPEVGTVLSGAPHTRPVASVPDSSGEPELPDFLKPMGEEVRKLNVVIKADTAGSLEAILAAFSDRIDVIGKGIGDITEADILLAKSAQAFVVGFNVGYKPQVEKLAQTEKVVFRTYRIIYELLDELSEVVSGMKEVLAVERELGRATILAEFPFDNQRVAGVKVDSGRLVRSDQVKLVRDEKEIGRAKIKTIRQGKAEVSKVEAGTECGILFDRKVDFQLNDAIIPVTSS